MAFIGDIVGQYIGEDKTTKPAKAGEMVVVQSSTSISGGEVRSTRIYQFSDRTEVVLNQGQRRVYAETSPLQNKSSRPGIKYFPHSKDTQRFTTGFEALGLARQMLAEKH